MAEKKKKRGVPPPKDETKEQRFIRVVTPRVNKTVKMMGNIAHCSGAAYAYTPQQVEQMSGVILAAYNSLVKSFAERKAEADKFKFTPQE